MSFHDWEKEMPSKLSVRDSFEPPFNEADTTKNCGRAGPPALSLFPFCFFRLKELINDDYLVTQGKGCLAKELINAKGKECFFT